MADNCKTCPHCGAPLPAEASFCPRCAQSVNRRRTLSPPSRGGRRTLRRIMPVLVLLLFLGGGTLWVWAARPQVYEGTGEVTYPLSGVPYRLFLTNSAERPEPLPRREITTAVSGEPYRAPVLLYIDGGAGGAAFLEQVERVTAEFPTVAGNGGNFSCTAPSPHSAFPGIPLVSLMDYTVSTDCTAQMTWTFTMKNGDTIRLRQEVAVSTARTYDYYPTDAPMSTAAELQALLDELADTLEPDAEINLHLPAVTYEAVPITASRSFNFYGSTQGEQRTTFTAPLRLEAGAVDWISYLYDISFQGPGSGTALSAVARVWVEGCAFTGWDTGVLCAGISWGNVIDCDFTGNGVGFHFDSAGGSASHSMYNDNLFRDNGTAVLLERVPTDLSLNFQGSVFAGNGTDVDNRCGQPLDLSGAVFP